MDNRGIDRLGARVALALSLATSLAMGCGTEPEPEPEPDENNTTPRERPQTSSKWERGTLAADGALLMVAGSGADGQLGVAMYATEPVDDGDCEELEVDTPPTRRRWPITYAGWDAGSKSFTTEEVSRPLYVGAPTGLDLGFSTSGEPQIAAMIGEPVAQIRYCGANDVGLLTRSGGAWQEETAVVTSGEAATGEPGSDYGDVVGYFPSLAYDASGAPAIAYKDVHSGSIQSDDRRRADLELAWRQGGGWSALPVDFGQGAGDYNQLLFDPAGDPIIAYYVPTESLDSARQGIWVTRSQDDGQTWERVQLWNRANSERPSVVVDPETGSLHVMFYHSDKGYPALATLDGDGAFDDAANGWTIEDIGDSRYDEGYSPSIAVSPTGRLAVAYYRCARSADGLGECTTASDAVVFAWRDGDGTWTQEVVDEGSDDGFCGEDPTMAFDAQGRPVIAYRCDESDGGGDAPIKYAVREALP